MDKQILKIRIKESLREGNLRAEDYESLLDALDSLTKEEQANLLLEVFEEMEQEPFSQEIPRAAMLDAIWQDPRMQDEKPVRKLSVRWAWAAAVAVFVAFGVYFMQTPSFEDLFSVDQQIVQEMTIQPGQEQAILVLPNGREIALDSLQEGEVMAVGGLQVSLKDGVIRYDGAIESEIQMNTIRTPLGGDYHATLPDGTKVWLNAGSSISYPVAFTGAKREVTMQGEVYFEVAKDKKHPFIVHAKESSIQVLGTQFNVSAYPEDAALKATLIEGSIDFKHATEHRLLSPGHQAVVQNGQTNIAVHSIDVEEATAWKNGYFYFNNEDLASAMQKIARWYDVEVVYKGKVGQKKLDGTISRMADIKELLKLLNLTGTAHFSIKERRIEVQI